MSDAPSHPSTAATTRCQDLTLDIPPSCIDQDLAVWSALANETRYRIMRLLQDHDEVCVCDIDASLEASQSAISHALANLHDAGLVDRRKDGRWRYYRITPVASSLLTAMDSRRGETDE